ncbi:hypothetical protein PB1_02770 [Bacillus methanolicus PB1]|uniref:Integral membrane protein n=1 Tax=Bacillus methanolicus PB1 TaxID=997296 RepID=I3E5Q6_BACMT|nr:DUF1360 domain-containing protein [Bacillus methanolicus]EIJ81827.1 hypothetical protein PB1_02770 [Bacillus methanolicus PB1]
MSSDFTFWNVILMGLASFRLTRLIVFDQITYIFRKPFFDEITEVNKNGENEVYLAPKQHGFKKWMGELLSCYWCTGIWASIFVIYLYFFASFTGKVIILILAVAAIGSIIEVIISKILGN